MTKLQMIVRDFVHGFKRQKYHVDAWLRLINNPYNESNHHHAFNMLNGDCVSIYPKPVWVVNYNYVNNICGQSCPVNCWFNESEEYEDDDGNYMWKHIGTFWINEKEGVVYSI